MGEYEDRYPDAYHVDVPSVQSPPGVAPAPRQSREPAVRTAFGGAAAAPENAAPQSEPGRRHAPSPTDNPPGESTGVQAGSYRGRGPRGYVRPLSRIYEDICDRLTDDPLIDASDIEVAVGSAGVVLAGSVENDSMLRRVEAMAREVPGVMRLQSRLTVRPSERGPSIRRADR